MKIEIMGKKILTAMIVAVVAVVAGYNIYVSQKDITCKIDLIVENRN